MQISAFVLKHALVTVHPGDWFDIDTIVGRWDENAELMSFGVKALAWGMLDVLVDGHFEVVQALDDEIEGLEDILFDQARAAPPVQRRTFALRKSLVRARRAVLPMREVVNTLSRRDNDLPTSCGPTSRTSTTTCCAPPSGPSRCATWSARCSRPTSRCRTPG